MRVMLLIASLLASTHAASAADRTVENLAAAGRAVGYVRYFYPSDECQEADWDAVTAMIVQRTWDAPSPEALADAIEKALAPIAPALQIWPTAGEHEEPPVALEPEGRTPNGWIGWHHSGVRHANAQGQQSIYNSRRTRTRDAGGDGRIAKASSVITNDLGGGVSCRMPIVLAYDDEGIMPAAEGDVAAAEPGDARSVRVAAVITAWNMFQHFYPYFDVVDVDWADELPRALADVWHADDRGTLDVLRRMVSALHDGHGYVNHPSDRGFLIFPLLWSFVGHDLVIVQVAPVAGDVVQMGDVVTAIDGRAIAEIRSEMAGLVSASTDGFRDTRIAQELRRGTSADPVRLDIRRADGSEVSVQLARRTWNEVGMLAEPTPEDGDELAPGIVYFDLNQATMDDLEAAMPKLETARAMVLDLRGYPSDAGKMILHHMTDEIIHSAWWNVPVTFMPDQLDVSWRRSRWTMQPLEPRLRAPAVFITDGRAISYAESCMAIVEHYDLGAIVGATTAGTNGNVNPTTLPGGYMVAWTGMKVTKHDDTTHHGVGVVPTHPVERTVAGIAAGRDELLEHAIAVAQDLTK